MNTFPVSLRSALIATLCVPLLVSIGAAQERAAVTFGFTTFTVPGAVSLSVVSINDSDTISGYYTDAAGDTISYLRASDGTVTTQNDPYDEAKPSFMKGGQINRNGSVGAEYFNSIIGDYEGDIYESKKQLYVPFTVPQPQFSTTAVTGLNDYGNLCGFVSPPPYTLVSAFVEVANVDQVFSVNGSAYTACAALNNSQTAVGYYLDSAGVYHGFMRTSSGTITTIDHPAAATVTGTAPCVSGPVAGTVPLGINNSGYVSGHYWDKAYNEHGFIMTPSGKFLAIDVPGAYQTSGGGLNDKVQVPGHYADNACNTYGFIATP